MANVLTINDLNAVRVEQREKTITYSVALSGNYAQAVRGQNVGEVLDLTKVQSTQYLPEQFWKCRAARCLPTQHRFDRLLDVGHSRCRQPALAADDLLGRGRATGRWSHAANAVGLPTTPILRWKRGVA